MEFDVVARPEGTSSTAQAMLNSVNILLGAGRCKLIVSKSMLKAPAVSRFSA
jgi:hypothetical protein